MATKADYEEVLAGHRKLVRDLDVAMHGEEGAAKQASLCDLIGPARKMREQIDDLWWALEHATDHMEPDDECEECKEISKLHVKYRRGM